MNIRDSLLKNTKYKIVDCNDTYSSQDIRDQIVILQKIIDTNSRNVIGNHCENNISWVVCDLFCIDSRYISVPIPKYFSDSQKNYVISKAKLSYIISDSILSALIMDIILVDKIKLFTTILYIYKYNRKEKLLDLHNYDICKITFSSGTTGEPKGVLIRESSLIKVLSTLNNFSINQNLRSHLCVLPLSILLENIAGLYLSIITNNDIVLINQNEIGFENLSDFDVNRFFNSTNIYNCSSIILVPEMLKKIVNFDISILKKYKTIAVGGAPIDKETLDMCLLHNIKIFSGYGLSESTSVVSINDNFCEENKYSSGKVLQHIETKINNGQIFVKGSNMAGYIDDTPLLDEEYIATGDLGYIDANNNLYITGRKSNYFVTSYGKNIEYAWIENEMKRISSIPEVYVLGDNMPYISCIIFSDNINVKIHLKELNKILPKYAEIKILHNYSIRSTLYKTISLILNIYEKREYLKRHIINNQEEISNEIQ